MSRRLNDTEALRGRALRGAEQREWDFPSLTERVETPLGRQKVNPNAGCAESSYCRGEGHVLDQSPPRPRNPNAGSESLRGARMFLEGGKLK